MQEDNNKEYFCQIHRYEFLDIRDYRKIFGISFRSS